MAFASASASANPNDWAWTKATIATLIVVPCASVALFRSPPIVRTMSPFLAAALLKMSSPALLPPAVEGGTVVQLAQHPSAAGPHVGTWPESLSGLHASLFHHALSGCPIFLTQMSFETASTYDCPFQRAARASMAGTTSIPGSIKQKSRCVVVPPYAIPRVSSSGPRVLLPSIVNLFARM